MKIFHCKDDSKQTMKRISLFRNPFSEKCFHTCKELSNAREGTIQIWKPFITIRGQG